MNLYTDFIRNKPVKLLNSSNTRSNQKNQEDQLSPRDAASHSICADMEEFSELLSKVSTLVIWNKLLRQDQRVEAMRRWQEAANRTCEPEHLEMAREHMISSIENDHLRQWEEASKQGKLDHIQ